MYTLSKVDRLIFWLRWELPKVDAVLLAKHGSPHLPKVGLPQTDLYNPTGAQSPLSTILSGLTRTWLLAIHRFSRWPVPW